MFRNRDVKPFINCRWSQNIFLSIDTHQNRSKLHKIILKHFFFIKNCFFAEQFFVQKRHLYFHVWAIFSRKSCNQNLCISKPLQPITLNLQNTSHPSNARLLRCIFWIYLTLTKTTTEGKLKYEKFRMPTNWAIVINSFQSRVRNELECEFGDRPFS